MTFTEESCVLIVDHLPDAFLMEDLPFENAITNIHIRLENNFYLKVLLTSEETKKMYPECVDSDAYFSLNDLLRLHSCIMLFSDENFSSLEDLAMEKFKSEINYPLYKIIKENSDNKIVEVKTPFRCRNFNCFLKLITKTLLQGMIKIVNNE